MFGLQLFKMTARLRQIRMWYLESRPLLICLDWPADTGHLGAIFLPSGFSREAGRRRETTAKPPCCWIVCEPNYIMIIRRRDQKPRFLSESKREDQGRRGKLASRSVRMLLGRPGATVRKADLLLMAVASISIARVCVCVFWRTELRTKSSFRWCWQTGWTGQNQTKWPERWQRRDREREMKKKTKKPLLIQGYSSICYLIRWERIWADEPTKTCTSSHAWDKKLSLSHSRIPPSPSPPPENKTRGKRVQ